MAAKPPKITAISPLLHGYDTFHDQLQQDPTGAFTAAVTFIADYLADRDIVNIDAAEVELMAAMLISFSSKTNCGFIEAMPALINLFRCWATISLIQPDSSASSGEDSAG